MELLFYSAIGLMVFCVVALVLMPLLLRPTTAEARLMGMVHTERDSETRVSATDRLQEGISAVVRRARGAKAGSGNGELSARLASAGFRQKESADLYTAARVLAPLAGIVAATFVPSASFMPFLIGGAIGYLGPDMWLRSRIKKRRERIRRGFPDAVDLLVICMDAGLGLDQGLLRVGQELSFAQPDISQELVQLNLEQRAGKPRMEAWQSLATRTQVPDIAAFVSMLAQTDRFGTPILSSLGRLSNDIRLRRRQHAEEAAAKLKIKILFPLALFIFPCIFIVLLAPAVITIGKTLGSLGQ